MDILKSLRAGNAVSLRFLLPPKLIATTPAESVVLSLKIARPPVLLCDTCDFFRSGDLYLPHFMEKVVLHGSGLNNLIISGIMFSYLTFPM